MDKPLIDDLHLHKLFEEDIYVISDENVQNNQFAKSGKDTKEATRELLLIITQNPLPEHQTTIRKLVEAIKFDPNLVKIGEEWLDDYESAKYVLIIGFEEKNQNQEFYQPFSKGSQSILWSASLEILDSDRSEKLKLWEALKGWLNI